MRRAARILLVSKAIVDGFEDESKTLHYGSPRTNQPTEIAPRSLIDGLVEKQTEEV